MLPFARARRHVIGHAGASRASLKPAGPRDRATPLQDRAIELRSSRWRVGARRHSRASLSPAGSKGRRRAADRGIPSPAKDGRSVLTAINRIRRAGTLSASGATWAIFMQERG